MSPDELIQLRALLVEPAIAALKAQSELHQKAVMELVSPAVAKVDGFDERMRKLEHERGMVVKGAVVYSTVVASLVGWFLAYLKSKIFR
jgi:hypothetical protein